MFAAFMATKTISLNEVAYERLSAQRQGPGDSFSRIVMRAHWENETVTAGELLRNWKDEPPFFSDEELESISKAKENQTEPIDKWAEI